jgi:hypothetical protein
MLDNDIYPAFTQTFFQLPEKLNLPVKDIATRHRAGTHQKVDITTSFTVIDTGAEQYHLGIVSKDLGYRSTYALGLFLA